MNTLYYGDNLEVLREYVGDESVDLIYLDPPFNSARDYNVLFAETDDSDSDAQIRAFEDSWHWGPDAETAYRTLTDPDGASSEKLVTLMEALRSFLGTNDMMAYLTMMAVRLVELHRVLKSTGSLYLHCDPTASHYLKVILDGIFGAENFRNEIIWKRTHAHGDPHRNFGAVTDTIFYYTKTDGYDLHPQHVAFEEAYAARRFSYTDPDGRRWQSVTLRSPSPRPNLTYPYKASNGITYQPHPNGWSCDEERMKKYDREKRLHFPAKPGGNLRLKMYFDESSGVKVQSLWDDIPPVNSQAAERLGYPTQKPVALLERIINLNFQHRRSVISLACR
jgi:site-specific DNA-methyltransferase (adenine-specific)